MYSPVMVACPNVIGTMSKSHSGSVDMPRFLGCKSRLSWVHLIMFTCPNFIGNIYVSLMLGSAQNLIELCLGLLGTLKWQEDFAKFYWNLW